MTSGEIILKLIKDVGGIELELGEEFNIGCNLLKVTQEGLFNVDNGYACSVSLQEFIEDIKVIKIKNKFPKDDTKYYCIAKDNIIYDWLFSKYVTIDVLNYKTGNFFLTFEEAKKNKEKILKILNSPERFEVNNPHL